jgi:PKD repeat protein
MQRLLSIIYIFSLCFVPCTSHAVPTDYQIQVNFSFNPPPDYHKQVLAYRLFQDSQFACESIPTETLMLDCTISSEPGTYSFTLAALYNDGSLSPHSPPFPFTFANASPELAALITASTTMGVAPLNLSFDGSGSPGDITTYDWNLGDGNSASGATVSHTYQLPGTYTATLVVTDTTGNNHQTSLAITVTEPPPPPPEPPTAVISSSNAVGEAPYTISFDGSGSYSNQPPITSYTWDFGDGSTASGVTVSHTYLTAGSYNVALHITDSAGLTAETSTPALITNPPPENQAPTAAFSVIMDSGDGYTIIFDGSASNDPDGSLESFTWNFGDGTTATGVTTQHTFPAAADYHVTLAVTDNLGKTATTTQTISIFQETDAVVPMEVGEIQINNQWVRVQFSQPFIDPVVIAGPPSYADAAPVTVRIRNITTNGFDIRLQEWDYLDGRHNLETLSYITLEKGIYTLPDGSKLEAGTFTSNTTPTTVTLQQTYNQSPALLSQVITEFEQDAVTGRIKNVTKQSFSYKLQEQERTKNRHGFETIAYVAWEPGQGDLNGLTYKIATTGEEVDSNWSRIDYQHAYPETPFFLAEIQTTNSDDPVTVRTLNGNNASIEIKLQEEQSKDRETSHPKEQIGYMVIAPKDLLQ